MDSFIGEIRILPYLYAPVDWAWCNGQALPISQNQALYSVITTTYGGGGGGTFFSLPNLRDPNAVGCGCVAIGAGQGPGLTNRVLGPEPVGTSTVTLTTEQTPVHTHDFNTWNYLNSNDAQSTASGAALARGVVNNPVPIPDTGFNTYVPPDASPVELGSAMLAPVGGGQPHSNQQPYVTMNFCISLAGEYPLRPD